jgi:hypothetical protein
MKQPPFLSKILFAGAGVVQIALVVKKQSEDMSVMMAFAYFFAGLYIWWRTK